jgi:hypothetical protein
VKIEYLVLIFELFYIKIYYFNIFLNKKYFKNFKNNNHHIPYYTVKITLKVVICFLGSSLEALKLQRVKQLDALLSILITIFHSHVGLMWFLSRYLV